ncbi:DUF5712 family protein [Mucilaginibacter lappiensis]|uniref:Mobilization protein n=1 Tax=Mucilaginibacter lappiensis TaxID=354630 RepID=A0A841J6H2_9SPHI|nr:DUF5712 family protein [Mucilaginibacter lappiensis]MBB6126374.1 hypothetical protein [Mucilaginibacter lappiensis]
MHINISKSETGNNKDSSGQLVNYLEKENKLLYEQNSQLEPEYWFNQESQQIQPYQVRYDIDQNTDRLSKDEAKFFLVNISPSENELLFLKEEFGEDGAKQQLKQYANQVMDEYARNFKKDQVQGNNDILYFGKLENHRYYTHKDEEVKQGLAKRGEQKPGEQMHIQIIVSRKDMTDSIRLSPLNNSRGRNATHSLKVGQFDRVAFKQAAERTFDQAFDYDRELKETFIYSNTLKHGDYGQRLEIKKLEKQEQEQKRQEKQELKRELKLQEEIEQSRKQSRGLTQGRW